MGIFGWSIAAGAMAYLAERISGDIEEAVEDLTLPKVDEEEEDEQSE